MAYFTTSSVPQQHSINFAQVFVCGSFTLSLYFYNSFFMTGTFLNMYVIMPARINTIIQLMNIPYCFPKAEVCCIFFPKIAISRWQI